MPLDMLLEPCHATYVATLEYARLERCCDFGVSALGKVLNHRS